ncbi:hypothetical protein CP533_3523 [Ophiocordyceps camponoti-saundersi (nom. inval.)]|nr:hypothetical protein CP533_3523 [Ophiocordyceps camponoti-saundersi (nom. inval.)]
MRLLAFVVALPALTVAQYTAPAATAPSTTTQTSTTLLTKTIFLSRVNPVTSTAQYNTTESYAPVMANATQAVVSSAGAASNMLPTAAATLPASQVISAAGSLDARPIALSGIAALLAFAFL